MFLGAWQRRSFLCNESGFCQRKKPAADRRATASLPSSAPRRAGAGAARSPETRGKMRTSPAGPRSPLRTQVGPSRRGRALPPAWGRCPPPGRPLGVAAYLPRAAGGPPGPATPTGAGGPVPGLRGGCSPRGAAPPQGSGGSAAGTKPGCSFAFSSFCFSRSLSRPPALPRSLRRCFRARRVGRDGRRSSGLPKAAQM